MKKINILAIAFVIGSSSLFASAFNNPRHLELKNSDSENPFQLSEQKTDLMDSVLKNKIGSDIYTTNKNIKLYNLNHNNKDILLKEMQLEAVKNYAYIMPEIIGKE